MTAPILIIGGTGGIGQAIARRLRAAGTPVHLMARDETRLAALASEIGASFGVVDVEQEGALGRSVEAAAAAAGGVLGGLCYAVGSINLKPLSRLTAADFERDFRLNAMGAALAVQTALPALKKTQGTASVLLFSTVAAAQGFSLHACVAMAKGAVEGLTRALAAELAPKIRVNCLAPSLTRTPLAASLTANDAMAGAIAQLHALPRLGEAEDIAPLAALLLSSESGWITGQVIGVDGGRSTLRTKG
jgi:NAD(P)-dependent dehydrogenase (short-subunit alcohol dehydrogenase family)